MANPGPRRRRYSSVAREEQARRTRSGVLTAATTLFVDRGYGATTMRAVATASGVSVPTVEALFGSKPRLLKAAIDLAIAGDDEPVALLDRSWARRAAAAITPSELLLLVMEVLVPTQIRSAGLLLSLFEGAATDPGLAQLAERKTEDRSTLARWLVDRLAAVGPLRPGLERDEAIDTCWLLIDPAVFHRLTVQRGWGPERYGRWLADTLSRLLIDHPPDGSSP